MLYVFETDNYILIGVLIEDSSIACIGLPPLQWSHAQKPQA